MIMRNIMVNPIMIGNGLVWWMSVWSSSLLQMLALAQQQQQQPQQLYQDCSVDTYYSGLDTSDVSTWNKQMVHDLITSTHRNSLVDNNSGQGDVWAALQYLDRYDSGTDSPFTDDRMVRVAYNDKIQVLAVPYDSADTWTKEYLWPLTRGIEYSGVDFTDVHNIRPIQFTSKGARGDKVFGECSTSTMVSLNYGGSCVSPASGGDDTTCSCNTAYQVNEAMRGEVARTIMYMDVRYDGTDANTADLNLTDCPFNPSNEMAYRSTLLSWHQQYPPTSREITRNQEVCESYQGNRNPFVDIPDLAAVIFGQPLPALAANETGREIYPICDGYPTMAPTSPPSGCDLLEPGDIYFMLVNSVDPDEVAFFLFNDLPPNIELYMTDNAWTGSGFQADEGTMKFTVPSNGVPGGTWMGYGPTMPRGSDWETVDGFFALGTEGDQVFLYCFSGGDVSKIHHVAALSYNGPFLPATNTFTYGTNTSALPDELLEADAGYIALGHELNWMYNGKRNLQTEELKAAMKDPNQWIGRSSKLIPSGAFTTLTSSWLSITTTTLMTLSASFVMMIW